MSGELMLNNITIPKYKLQNKKLFIYLFISIELNFMIINYYSKFFGEK